MCATPTRNEPAPQTHMVDVLIIGQGIAGSLLGWELRKRGLQVAVVDDGHKTSASMVAAGMISPVQGRRLNTIWEIEHCLPAALRLYREIEAQTGKTFFFPKKVLHLIRDSAQAETLQERLADPAFSAYFGASYSGQPEVISNCFGQLNAPSLRSHTPGASPDCHHAPDVSPSRLDTPNSNPDSHKTPDATAHNTVAHSTHALEATAHNTHAPEAFAPNPNAVDAPYGWVEIVGGGYLNTQNLLQTLRDFFCKEGMLIEAQFAHTDLDLSDPHSVRWHTWQARRIVFAEGWRTLNNPFFANHPFFATKGQIVTVHAEHPLPDYVINRGHWLVPQTPQTAWLGATYERGVTDAATTTDAQEEILASVQACIPGNRLEPQGQRAGVRLAAPDHIPRMGFLPDNPCIGLFSAFGSKGNCLAPYLAHCMAEHITSASPLPPATDIGSGKNGKWLKQAGH